MREAVFSVSDSELAALGLDELVSLCRSAGLREFEELACQGTGAIVQITVGTRLDEDRIETLDYVTKWERLSESDDEFLYLIAFTAPGLSERITAHTDELIGTCSPDVNEQGATMSLVGPQEAIRGTLTEYEMSGMVPELRKLSPYEGGDHPLNHLTDRQYEVIQTAYDMGYYEVPREASTADLAAELDLDPSTVAEHLQRAERNLLAEQLSP